MPLKIIFAGTPAFALPTLKALIDSPHEIMAVYCQPDRPKGRGQSLNMSPCKTLAQNHNIAVKQPINFKSESNVEQLKKYQADLMIVVAYGLILPETVLSAPRLGCINVHASLLPKWRGAAPIQRAIQAGDAETGITIMQMDKGLDTGNILKKAPCAILAQDTHGTMLTQLGELGAETLMKTLDDIAYQRIDSIEQDHNQACYANKIHKAEAPIDWNLPAKNIDCHIRALSPWPVAETTCPKGRLRLHMSTFIKQDHQEKPGTVVNVSKEGIDVAAPGGLVRLLALQLPNQRILEAHTFINGQKDWLLAGKCIFSA